jgi:hypothetical protein
LHLTTRIKSRAERHANIGVTLIAWDLLRPAPATNRDSLHRAAPQAEPGAGAGDGRISQPRIQRQLRRTPAKPRRVSVQFSLGSAFTTGLHLLTGKEKGGASPASAPSVRQQTGRSLRHKHYRLAHVPLVIQRPCHQERWRQCSRSQTGLALMKCAGNTNALHECQSSLSRFSR